MKRLDKIREDIPDLKVLELAYRRTGLKAPAFFLAFFLALSLAIIASRRALSVSASASLMPRTGALLAEPVVAGFTAGAAGETGAAAPKPAGAMDAGAGAWKPPGAGPAAASGAARLPVNADTGLMSPIAQTCGTDVLRA